MMSMALTRMSSIGKNSLLLVILFFLVMMVNAPVISYDMMYAEQPMVYLANQSIHSLGDLLHVYAHPKLLDVAVPFFRPTGHFLMYKIMMPILGWHNTRGLLIVSLSFLALTGFVMIRTYQLLFPKLYIGGYIAFAIYLMQPALMLARLTIMHFDFAYVFFVLLSLYWFVLFCKKNHLLDHANYYSCDIYKIKFSHQYLIFLSCLSYVIAATFKEPALMLGPVLASYLFIALYHRTPIRKWLLNILKNKELVQIILLITVTTLVLAVYLTLPWPTMVNPERHVIQMKEMWGAIKEFTQLIFSINQTSSAEVGLYSPGLHLRHIVVPPLTHIIIWSLLVCALLSTALSLCGRLNKPIYLYQKSVFFLLLTAGIFLILPIGWAAGLPWHLSLTLLFLSLVLGFCCESLLRIFFANKVAIMLIGFAGAMMIASSTLLVDQVNIKYIADAPEGFAYKLGRNAVLHPPAIKQLMNADSVVVVEDSLGVGDYGLGDGGYPLFILEDFDYEDFNKKQKFRYVQYQPKYNGTLFRFAYLMPELKEEYYPFKIENMQSVSDEAIYDWLRQGDNIFCVGYDKNGIWSDRTRLFKKNLIIEKQRRHLMVNEYHILPSTNIKGTTLYAKKLALPEASSCQQVCDQDAHCKGLTYVPAGPTSTGPLCYFYSKVLQNVETSCAFCTSYIKKIII